jgi:hypothetical protein
LAARADLRSIGWMHLPSFCQSLLASLSRRRTHRRMPAVVPVDWRVFGTAVHCVSTTADLSPGGAFVHTASLRPVDTPLVLEIATPSGEVEVHARVAWTGPRGMGVRFTRAVPLTL